MWQVHESWEALTPERQERMHCRVPELREISRPTAIDSNLTNGGRSGTPRHYVYLPTHNY